MQSRPSQTASDTRPAPADSPPVGLSKDDAFHLLQNARRRTVLRYLLEHDDREQFVMRDVAEVVAAWEHDLPARQLRSAQRQRVYIALYQSHLPKLDEHDVIEYNQSRGIIRPGPLLEAVAPYLADGVDATDHQLAGADEADGAGAGGVRESVGRLRSWIAAKAPWALGD